jgi:hypothetical protein
VPPVSAARADCVASGLGVRARCWHPGARPALRKQLPGSGAVGNVLLPEQRVGTTGRGAGSSGVYAAYEHGYPSASALDVDRLGSRTPVVVATFKNAGEALAGSSLTAAPDGRLWVAWFFGDGTPPALFARQSNTAATKYGATQKIALPPGTTTVWKVYLDAQATKLDLVALVIQHNNSKDTAYWHAQIPQP